MQTSKPIKILYVITKSNWGGAQRYVFDLATSLNKNATPPKAWVATSSPSGYQASVALGGDGLLAQKLKIAGIPVIPVPALERDISLLKDFAAFRALLKIFRAERPDVVHLNSSKIGLFGALAGRLAGIKKIVFTAHGWAFNEDRALPIKLFLYFMSALTGLLATNIIVLSDKELAQTKKLPFIFRKTRRIYNGIKKFESLSRDEARKLLPKLVEGLPNLEDKIVIGTIAELHPNKGLEYAIKAFSSLKTISYKLKPVFIIIGSGQEESRLHKLIKNLGLEKTIFLTGFIENASQYLPAFDIFMLTSLKEGLPYVVLEAGLTGLPIVATNVGALPELLNKNQLVPPKNIGAITAALQPLLANPSERTQIGAETKARLSKLCDFQKMLGETTKIYNL